MQILFIMKQDIKLEKLLEELGGTMPEDLPTPKKSLKELEKENKLIKSNN